MTWECPFCGSTLLTFCNCCEEIWCPMCDKHIYKSDLNPCPGCGKKALVLVYRGLWRCFNCSYETEVKPWHLLREKKVTRNK